MYRRLALSACLLAACVGPGRTTSSPEMASIQVPGRIAPPCLSLATFENVRLLVPHALVAETAGRPSRYRAGSGGGDDAQIMERERLAMIAAGRAATILAAQRAPLDADGCRHVAPTAEDRGQIQYLVARWLHEGRIAVRVGDTVVERVHHRPQADVSDAGLTGSFHVLDDDGNRTLVLALPPVVRHHWDR